MSVEHISLFVDNSSVVNGLGKSVKTADTILKWGRDLQEFQSHLASKDFPTGYSLLVPDFWHIAYGDAKCLPKAEADELWESTVEARKAAEPFIESTEMVLSPHPGTKLHLKNFVPYKDERKEYNDSW